MSWLVNVLAFGPKETGATLAGARAIPAEAHHFEQEPLEFGRVLRRDDNDVAQAARAADEAAVWPARDERSRRPLLRIEQLVLIAHGIAEANQLFHAALLAEGGVALGELDTGSAEFLDGRDELEPAPRFPANVGQSIDCAWMKREAVTAIVELEVQRVRVRLRRAADLKAHHLRDRSVRHSSSFVVSKPR